LLAAFAMGQVAAQLLNVLSGFLIVRWLTIGDYARYGLVYSFQSTTNVLIDLGFSTTIIALVGSNWNEPKIIGKYVRAGRSLRNASLTVVFPLAALIFFRLTLNLKWDALTQISFIGSILVAVYCSGVQAYYGVTLLLRRKLSAYYRLQVFSALIRTAGCFLIYRLHLLNAPTAVWINVLAIAFLALGYSRASKPLMEMPARPDSQAKQQIIQTMVPHLPSLIFFALQAQISVFLIATFGQAKAIGEVSALARLGQMFVFLGASNPALIEPWLARSPKDKLFGRFLLVTTAATLLVFALVIVSLIAPGVFLSLLGANYSNLKVEVTWQLITSGVFYVMSVVWTASTSRRFIYWTTSWFNIAALLVTEVLFIVFIGVSTTLKAIQFGFAMGSASLIVYMLNFLYGLLKGPRVKIPVETSVAA
jgi:O-antigen/teichoic acid export membrane protein